MRRKTSYPCKRSIFSEVMNKILLKTAEWFTESHENLFNTTDPGSSFRAHNPLFPDNCLLQQIP